MRKTVRGLGKYVRGLDWIPGHVVQAKSIWRKDATDKENFNWQYRVIAPPAKQLIMNSLLVFFLRGRFYNLYLLSLIVLGSWITDVFDSTKADDHEKINDQCKQT